MSLIWMKFVHECKLYNCNFSKNIIHENEITIKLIYFDAI